MRRREILAATAALASARAWAQPPRPIRLVVPYPPGGPLDRRRSQQCIQLHGGIGVTDESIASHY